jgi:hypothetical protein
MKEKLYNNEKSDEVDNKEKSNEINYLISKLDDSHDLVKVLIISFNYLKYLYVFITTFIFY